MLAMANSLPFVMQQQVHMIPYLVQAFALLTRALKVGYRHSVRYPHTCHHSKVERNLVKLCQIKFGFGELQVIILVELPTNNELYS